MSEPKELSPLVKILSELPSVDKKKLKTHYEVAVKPGTEGIPFCIGSSDETRCIVGVDYMDGADTVCLIASGIPKFKNHTYHVKPANLIDLYIALDTIHELKNEGATIFPEPKYKIDDVLYVKHDKYTAPSANFPALGSIHESDVKVLAVNPSYFRTSFVYTVYNPAGSKPGIGEQYLISASEKVRYQHKDYKEATVTFDALPFFSKDERVMVYDKKVRNLTETVIVPLTKELNNRLNYITE